MNKRKKKKIGAWLNYLIGFSGQSPTALDVKPSRSLGRKEILLLNKYKKVRMEVEQARKDAFRQACIDILGEDPEVDWN
jgi:hypothetical protein